jgi:hypothetical protein
MLHLRLIILLVEGDISVDNETLLMTDFMNLKIKPTHSFGGAYRSEYSYMYKYLHLYFVSKK